MRRILLFALALMFTGVACDNETRETGPCDEVFAFADREWCIVIEEGFLASDCPEEHPEGREFDDVVVCGDEEAPDEMRDELEDRGYLPVSCEDDPERGIVYVSDDPGCDLDAVVCPEGDEAFRNECGCGCRYVGECEDGATRTVDCNECWCVDGRWECTLIGCPECEDGETRTDIDECEVCECIDGFWSCTELIDCVPACTEGELRDFPETCQTCRCDGGGWSCVPDDECLAERCVEECDEPVEVDPSRWVCTADGFRPSPCVAGCYDLDILDDWASCAVCDEGESTEDGCLTSTCFEGRWYSSEDEWCVLDECIAACPASCVSADEQPCGANLDYYCTDCHLACYEVEEIDRASCEDPASTCVGTPPPDSTPVEWETWTPGEGCVVPEFDVLADRVFVGEDELAAEYGCTGSSDVQWDRERIVRVVFPERVDAEVVAVYDRGDELFVQMAAAAYCGGPAPPNSTMHVVVPLSDWASVDANPCTWGYCVGPPAP